MILKRSTITYTFAMGLTLLTGLTACTADEKEPVSTPVKPVMKGIALTIPLSETRAADDGFSLDSEQRKSLFIATYDKEGNLIEPLVQHGIIDRTWGDNTEESGKIKYEFDQIYDHGAYGTVLSIYLPAEHYKDRDGIQFAAVYLPEMTSFLTSSDDTALPEFNAPETLEELYSSVQNAYTLTLPAGEGSIWKPAAGGDVPMAGLLDVTSAIDNYDPAIWSEHNPMFLNEDPLLLERAMAKVIVEEGQNPKGVGHFTAVSFDTPNQGTLLGNPDVWNPNSHVTGVTPVEETINVTQTISVPEAEYGTTKTFEFYTFETLFNDDETPSRALIHVTWKNNGSLKTETKDVEFKFYGNAGENGQFGEDAACWKGILRNHLYHFIIDRPEEQNPVIQVKVENWTRDAYSVEL